jgi:hypothetical protein
MAAFVYLRLHGLNDNDLFKAFEDLSSRFRAQELPWNPGI